MTANRRKWNSMDQLEDVGSDSYLLPSEGSNLQALRHLSLSTPGISVEDLERDFASVLDRERAGRSGSVGGIIMPVQEGIEAGKPDEILKPLVPLANKARQKKFDRHFPINESILQYYSCALALDILLHGILYVTHNNFAFYSNVFGRVTKVVIPVSSIEKIQKSKTALIIPNAIHVHTNSEKYVFASFMSRENAYTQMQRVWSSFVAKSCGSKMHIIEPLLTTPSERKPKKPKRVKSSPEGVTNEGFVTEGMGREEMSPRKSRVMFADEPSQIFIPSQEEEFQIRKLSLDGQSSGLDETDYVNSEDEEEVEQSQTSEETSMDSPGRPEIVLHAQSRSGRASKTNRIILWVCYVLTLLLSLSAINLYFRIDAIIHEERSHLSFEQKELLEGQEFYHARMSKDFLERVNETIKRISMVHETLQKFSGSYLADRDGYMLPRGQGDEVA